MKRITASKPPRKTKLIALSEVQKTKFDQNGFLVFESFLTENELQILQERIDAMAEGRVDGVSLRMEAEAQEGGLTEVEQKNKVWQIMGATRHDEAVFSHAANPKILDVVEDLLGTPDIKLFSDQTLMKPAFHGSSVSWHQDSSYWTNIDPPDLISCWTALDDVTEENGCVRMLAGSHRQGIYPHRRDTFLHVEGLDVSKAVPVVMPAGGVSFHTSTTVHGSGPNRTPHRRRGLVTSYMRADSRFLGDPARKPVFPLLRGREYPGCV